MLQGILETRNFAIENKTKVSSNKELCPVCVFFFHFKQKNSICHLGEILHYKTNITFIIV